MKAVALKNKNQIAKALKKCALSASTLALLCPPLMINKENSKNRWGKRNRMVFWA
jgi:hypothetical protein